MRCKADSGGKRHDLRTHVKRITFEADSEEEAEMLSALYRSFLHLPDGQGEWKAVFIPPGENRPNANPETPHAR